jgi:hypothetical protein
MAPAPKSKCCRTTPRCRRCPVLLAAERRSTIQMVATLQGGGNVPSHLEGVPECLHKYEPLFRQLAAAA